MSNRWSDQEDTFFGIIFLSHRQFQHSSMSLRTKHQWILCCLFSFEYLVVCVPAIFIVTVRMSHVTDSIVQVVWRNSIVETHSARWSLERLRCNCNCRLIYELQYPAGRMTCTYAINSCITNQIPPHWHVVRLVVAILAPL